MRLCITIFILVALLHCSYAPPVTPEKKDQDSDLVDDVAEYTEYHRYLQEVVQALESDADFRERLEKADEDDVRSGRIAEQLDFVNHNVRSKLDEIKRRELDRLRHLATKQFELTNELDVHSKVPTNEHLDHTNPHTFEIEDLKKLIQKTTADLEAADKKRKEEFKEYEMQKEFEKHQKIESMNEAEKKEYMEAAKKEEEAKKHHQPLHHPASKDQLLEVWNTADNMDPKDFDPKVFFVMHDVDGNGVWDANEVKALFIKELNKMYGPTGPNTDLHERAEEMERMREHFFKENDRNHDGLIDYNEFMMETQKPEFNRDEGWQPIDENQIYTQAEYEAYERKRLETLHYLQQRGLVDAHGRPIPGAEHQIHQAIKQHQQQQQQMAYQQSQYHGAQGQYHPQGQPMGQSQYAPVQGYQQPPAYQQGQPQGQVPQGQQQGQYQGQVPQGQYQGQGQVSQGQYQGQVPQGQQQGQNQGQYQAPSQGQPIQQNQQQQQQQQQNVPVQAAQVPQAQQPPQAQSAPNVDSNHI
ncbi:nucleobindin-2 isoform X6 [Vanessa tameamea]|uniref:Nucleobindin-2 isoform X6 n=1 Tax=Vanessa tameamea TaxID=334116 RepID=A0A8B8IUH0_VANTA|nr:nucleobindin-2 isoform X8 [Vanessa tameamea]XP_026500800.1 nucleobindin-2 isoform X9 [Vanessa tameamea]